jgi:hypothetical protein
MKQTDPLWGALRAHSVALAHALNTTVTILLAGSILFHLALCLLDPNILLSFFQPVFFFAVILLSPILFSAFGLRSETMYPTLTSLFEVVLKPLTTLYLRHCLPPGGCWRQVIPTRLHGDLPDWLSRDQLRRELYRVRSLHYTLHAGDGVPWYPFVRVTISSYGRHHVHPHNSSHGRLMRVSRLPRGFYGTAADSTFFSDTVLNNVARAMHLGDYGSALANSRKQCPYAVPKKLFPYLTHAGIDTPPPHAQTHAHPIHYALRNQSLTVASRLLGSDWYALWLNQSRVGFIQSNGAANPSGFFNPRYEGKDITRFAGTALPGQATPISSSPIWFADDVLHHLSPTTVGSWFDDNPGLQYLVCTAVIPPETVYGFPTLHPELYDFTVDGDTLTYVPEGDTGGNYQQPFSARRWITTQRVITPKSLCIHVALIHTSYAHHVFVLSRPQLLPQTTRVLDFPKLAVIPWYSHPFASLYQRLTLPTLVDALVSYGAGVSATSMPDLYNKVRTYQQEVVGRFPLNYVEAAAAYAAFSRVSKFHHTPSYWSFATFNLTWMLSWPLLPFGWYFQSLTASNFRSGVTSPVIWTVKTTTWVSQSADRILPGLIRNCCPNDLSLYQLPPSAGLLARFTSVSAKLSVWLFLKISFFIASQLFRRYVNLLPRLGSMVAYLFDIHWSSSPLGIFFIMLGVWFDFRGPSVRVVNPLPHVYRASRFVLSWAYHLPYSGTYLPVGVSWPYILALNYLIVVLAFPHCSLPVIILDNIPMITPGKLEHFPTFNSSSKLELRATQAQVPLVDAVLLDRWGFSNVVLWTRLFLLAVMILSLCYSWWFNSIYDYLPSHDLESRHVPFTPCLPVSSSSETSATPSVASSTTFAAPRVFRAPSESDVTSDSASHMSWEPEVDVPPQAALPLPVRPPTPEPAPPVIPPVVPGDALANYNIPTVHFASAANWAQYLGRLPVPPNRLDVQTMCVWDCLSSVLGLDGRLLWANYVSTVPPMNRARFAGGLVLPEDLVPIFTHFRVGYTVHRAEGYAPGCPRGPGNAPPPPTFNPQHPPLHQATGAPDWPVLTAYLQSTPDGHFHLGLDALPNNQVFPNAMPQNVPIGWPSRLVPAVEIAEVLNVPAKAFFTVFMRLSGRATNMLSNLAAPIPFDWINFVLPRVPVVRTTVVYQPTINDAGYAQDLAADIKSDPSVLKLKEFRVDDVARTLDLMAKQWTHFISNGVGFPRQPVRLHLYHGACGTGKTYTMVRDIAAQHALTPYNPGNLHFHTWDHDLRGELQREVLQQLPNVGLLSNNFMTACRPLASGLSGTVVLDDAGKCWNSFIPLLIANNPGISDLYVTFDVCQAQGSFPVAPSISRKNPSTKDWLGRFSANYGTEIHRFAPDVCDLYGLPRAPPVRGRPIRRGNVITVSGSLPDVPLLAVSPRFTQTQSMGGQVADTFTESQGHTINGDVTIDLGGLTATATEHSSWTALSRATGNHYLKMGALVSKGTLVESAWSNSQILTALLTVASMTQRPYITAADDADRIVKAAVLSHISRCLSPAAAAQLGLPAPRMVVGLSGNLPSQWRQPWLNYVAPGESLYTARTYRAANSKSQSAPSAAFSRHSAARTTVHTDISHAVRHYTVLANDSVLTVKPTNYSLPPDPVLTLPHDPMLDIEEGMDDCAREVVLENTNSTFQHIHDGAPAALHHTRADKLTDLLGVQKRIRVGSYDGHWSKTDTKRLASLKKGFKKFFDVQAWSDEGLNEALLDRCVRSRLASWASKRTKRAINMSLDKQNPDMPFNFVKLFPKGQYIKKKAKWRGRAFPSQTVSDYNLAVIFRDAPVALYLESQALRFAYPTTYLHCHASPDDLSQWYRKEWGEGVMTGNDYTAWDSGVDHVFVEFVRWLLVVSGVPDEFVDRLVEEWLTTHSYIGPHQPRMESGRRWTWIVNTLLNAALTGASLDCPPRTAVCVSGDDSVVKGAWRQTTGFNPNDWLMKPKREEAKFIEFCGLKFGGPDITFDDEVIHWRSRFGLQQGRNDPDYWRSIRDSIREAASKLGAERQFLSSARMNLHRAVDWFGLPQDLKLPEAPPHVAAHSNPPPWLLYLLTPLFFIFFL